MRYEKFIPGILQYKLSFQLDEDFKKLNINQRSNKLTDSTLTKSYLAPLTISFNKKKRFDIFATTYKSRVAFFLPQSEG